MILRKLALFGFKSFADKSEIEFGTGITAVVGPNGCGKSNVVDAIRWVFGEQKASALRSSNMQDVIFSGTQHRQPLNMAEVTITIENNKGILPVEYNDIAITRRVFRNGESEYRLNKTPCRLRDIHNLFLDTGIGSNAYTTIENNMINTILSDKAEERRILFEEAAGIGKYKQRRKESEKKLEYTRIDLSRINDKVLDREKDVASLARQVEKAKRYRKWHDELKTLEVGYEDRHYKSLKEAMASRAEKLSTLDADHETLIAKMGVDETNIETTNLDMVNKETEVSVAGSRVADANELMVSIDKDISISEETLRHLRENVERFANESASIENQIQMKRDFRIKIEKSIIEDETSLEKHTEELVGIQDELASFDLNVARKRELTDELSTELIALINTAAEHRSAMSSLQNKLRNGLDQRQRDERELAILTTRSQECTEKLDECQRILSSANEQHAHLVASRETLVSRIEKEDGRYQELFAKEKQTESQIDSATSQLDFLKSLDASFEGYDAGVKAVLTKDLPGKLGIAASLIKITSDSVAKIVDTACATELQTIVFDTNENLIAAVEYLGKETLGSARMVSLERISHNAKAPLDGSLITDVTTAPEHAALAQYLFGSTILVDTCKDAMQKSMELSGSATLLAADGTVVRFDGTVVAGSTKRKHDGILVRKQRILALPAEIETLRRSFDAIVRDKDACIITRDEAKRALSEVNEKLASGQRRQQEQETNIKHYQNELDSISDRLVRVHEDLTQTTHTIAGLETSVASAQLEIDALAENHAVIERKTEDAKADVASLDTGRKAINERLTNSQLRIQGDKHRINQSRVDITNLGRDVENLALKQAQLASEQSTATIRIDELVTRGTTLKEDLDAHRSKRDELNAALAVVREEYNSILNGIEEVRGRIKLDRTRADEVGKIIYELRTEQTRAEEKMRALREKIFEAYKVDLESPPEDLEALLLSDTEVEESLRMYKERLKHLTGQVNMAAPEEYEEKSKELKDMITQRDDLQKAVGDLEEAIKTLNKEARTKFVETFEQVKQNYTQMFTRLFVGGEVQLSLEEGVDPLEAAIHINARPAGKKMRGVQLLSGGERALTAISLLFALYMVKPSAYCILDELDAPLDEANIERFVNVVRDFSAQTQFIIITHNKRTMEAADMLYGVTQQERGLSSVVSVKLEEAMRHAA